MIRERSSENGSNLHTQQDKVSSQNLSQPAPVATVIHTPVAVADIPQRLFGSFIEHMGRGVYGGIYEPEHPSADEYGFRHDVIQLVKELGVNCVRYPGGNFVSNYNWEDGTGPKEHRPIRRDLAWHSTETNEVGIDDFYRWSLQTDTEIMLAVNLGTRGLHACLEELEYVNGAAGTTLADRRIRNGIPKAMDVSMWCLGNEMDGPWQVGHMSAEEYAAAVDKVAHAMKLAESGLQLVACGSSSAHMPSFGHWERTVLDKAYENLDFISCHAYYYDRGASSFQDFLLSSEDMTQFIKTVAEICADVKTEKHSDHEVALSFDEWGVWYSDIWNRQEQEWKAEAKAGLHHQPWPQAPHLLEDRYTVADAVVEGSLMITLLKHCDRVRSASRAQLVNVIAPIMAEANGQAWRQSVFYPFAAAANFARGIAYAPTIEGPLLSTQDLAVTPAIDAVITWDEEEHQGLVLIVNRDEHQSHTATVDCSLLPGVADSSVIIDCAQMLHENDPLMCNSPEETRAVVPHHVNLQNAINGCITIDMPEISWMAIQFHTLQA
ncbi:alpha-N-arabinofuranosidase [Bifidobacterium sp.]|jgi:alpha-N-arabinofuranosidase|uniref:alpha-N-arabinofuranosidase n=1 Tax=Bifidobacterium sp. TaxID=41200 RepID=UPI0025C56B13|nr:alpha-L-arabinofuranosidase C-terminal domain-containing protein [Bifidobacterium sp.]MCI1635443.1 alpha-L-arabinofuranosidase [Bifidobacterium sp.]